MAKEIIDLEDTENFLESSDPTLTKIISNKNEVKFNGLSKEEIMRYGNDPFWVKIRWMLLIIFWAIWISMLTFAILIVIYSPKCPYRPKLKWWQNEVIYQVDVENFSDSDSNTLGDLNGLINKIDYFENLGVRAIALRDNILDQNYHGIKEIYGSLETLAKLKRELEKKELYLVLDLPYSKIKDNDTEILNFWLKSYVDGVRVYPSVPSEKLNEWLKIADQIHSETFRYKLIATTSNLNQSENEETYLNIGTDFSTGQRLENILNKIESTSKSNGYLISTYNTQRIADLIHPDVLTIYHSLLLLLKGSPIVLFGEEIGLSQTNPRMKWDMSPNCGFSQNKTFASNLMCHLNVKASLAHGSGETLLKIFKELIKLRREPSLNWGKIFVHKTDVKSKMVSYLRQADGFDGYLITANLGDNEQELVDLAQHFKLKSDAATVVYFYSVDPVGHDDFKINNSVSASQIMLYPKQFLILKV